jgi:hypothetical protein
LVSGLTVITSIAMMSSILVFTGIPTSLYQLDISWMSYVFRLYHSNHFPFWTSTNCHQDQTMVDLCDDKKVLSSVATRSKEASAHFFVWHNFFCAFGTISKLWTLAEGY